MPADFTPAALTRKSARFYSLRAIPRSVLALPMWQKSAKVVFFTVLNQIFISGRIKRFIFSIGRRGNPPRFGEWRIEVSLREMPDFCRNRSYDFPWYHYSHTLVDAGVGGKMKPELSRDPLVEFVPLANLLPYKLNLRRLRATSS